MLKNAVKRLIREDGPALPLVFPLYRLKRRLSDGQRLQLLPLTWMDQSAPDQRALLRRGKTITSFGPRFARENRQTVAEVNEPDVFCRLFRNARVSALSSSVVLDREKILVERVGSDTHAFDYATGHLMMHGPGHAIVKLTNSEAIDRGVFLGGNGANNYYHWIVEIAARSEFLPLLPKQYQRFPLLLSEDVQRIPSFRAIRDRLLSGHELIYLKNDLCYDVQELIWIDAPTNVPFNLFDDRRCETEFFFINPQTIAYLRRQLMTDDRNQHVAGGHAKRLYFARKTGRRGCNDAEIGACLARYGFTAVAMEELSFDQQVDAVRHADFIAGPSGAAWTNLIFCRPGTNCLCWMAEEAGDFAAFSNIAAAVGAELDYLTGKVAGRNKGKRYQQPFNIDIAELDAYLRRKLGAPADPVAPTSPPSAPGNAPKHLELSPSE